MDLTGLYEEFFVFLLIFSRMSGLFIYAPIFSAMNIPNQAKVAFCGLFSYIVMLTGVVSLDGVTDPIIYLIIKETFYGIGLGYIAYTFTSTFLTMGKILDLKMGFGMANVVDPQNRMQVAMMGNFYYIFALLIFLALDGHHLMLKAVYESYKYVGLVGFNFNELHMGIIIDSFIKAMEFGVTLSFPIILTTLLSDVLLGILSKTIPQLNIFVVGMPLKILVGFAILIFATPIYFELTQNIYEYMEELLMRFMRLT